MYKIAPHYTKSLLLVCFFVSLPVLAVFIVDTVIYELIAVSAIGAVAMIFVLFIDPIYLGRFSVDEEGLTIHCLSGKKHYHPWTNFIVVFSTYIFVTRDRKKRLYWIVFSKKPLTLEERNQFIQKTRWNRCHNKTNLDDYAYFQADIGILERIIPLLPKTLAESLRKELSGLGDALQIVEQKAR